MGRLIKTLVRVLSPRLFNGLPALPSPSPSPRLPSPFPSPLCLPRPRQEACRMRIEEHHFGSKADAGASKTYRQQAGTIRKNGYTVIKGRPCKVPHVTRTDYQLIDISEDGFVNLLTENGNTKDDLKTPN